MAQLVERSFLTPEIRSSNPIVGKILSTKVSTNCIIEETKIKKKRTGMAIIKKSSINFALKGSTRLRSIEMRNETVPLGFALITQLNGLQVGAYNINVLYLRYES